MRCEGNKREIFRVLGAGVCVAALAGCMAPSTPLTDSEPGPVQITTTQSVLLDLPPPTAPVPIAVYAFEDKSGQFKPQENVQTLSRAVSQGGAAILVKALRDAGNGGWFQVLERTGLDNLLKERKIIREMRTRYLGEKEFNPNALPPLLFAGVILEGGVVGFDSNTLTGGAGARFLGIGADANYRQNAVTVNLRAVSVKTGEVLANVTTTKTIASIGIQGGAFKYVSFDELLELEAGITNNEPDTLALRRTIEKSVHALIVEGSAAGLWSFADANVESSLIAARKAEQFGDEESETEVAAKPAKPEKPEGAVVKVSTPSPAPTAVASVPKESASSQTSRPTPAATPKTPAQKQPEHPAQSKAELAVSKSSVKPVTGPVKTVAKKPETPKIEVETPIKLKAPAPVPAKVQAPAATNPSPNLTDDAITRVVASGFEPVSMKDVMDAVAVEAKRAIQSSPTEAPVDVLVTSAEVKEQK